MSETIKMSDSDCYIIEKPTTLEEHVLNAGAHQAAKNLKTAIYWYTEALKLAPNMSELYVARGLCRFNTGNVNIALEDLNTATKLDPENAVAYHIRGFILQTQGYHEEAIDNFTTSLTIDPHKASTYKHRAISYDHKKDYTAAIADLTKYLDGVPDDKAMILKRGLLYELIGAMEEARADFKTLVELYPVSPHGCIGRAILGNNSKDIDIETNLLKAVECDPSFVEAYYLLGMHYLVQKNPEGMKYIEKARELGIEITDEEYRMFQSFASLCKQKARDIHCE